MPEGKAAGKQKEWDGLPVQEEYRQLLTSYTEPRHRARLLAASSDHSGDWLHVLPIAACGLHLDNKAVRVAVGLRLGCVLCESHRGLLVGVVPLSTLYRHSRFFLHAKLEQNTTSHTTLMTSSGALRLEPAFLA